MKFCFALLSLAIYDLKPLLVVVSTCFLRIVGVVPPCLPLNVWGTHEGIASTEPTIKLILTDH